MEGCGRTHEGKGFCLKHYKQLRREQGFTQKYNKAYLTTWIGTLNGRYSALVRAAKVKDLGFDISKEQHAALLLLPCVYCGGSLTRTGHGLDRKDSAKGYTYDNVVQCCVTCNRIKNKFLTHEEMLFLMRQLLWYRRNHVVVS